MSRSVRVLVSLAFCCFAALFAGCPDQTVKVGAVLPLSGEDQTYGEAVKKGMELAYDEILANADFTLQLEVSFADSASDPEKAGELLNQEYKNGALVAIGGVTSGEAMVMISVADKFDRILLSPSASSPELTGLSRNFYRIFPSDHAAAGKMAQFVRQDLKINKVAVVAEEQPYARGIQGAFKVAFEKDSGEVAEIEFPPNTVDFSGLMEHVKAQNTDAVYLAAYGDEIGSMIQELRNINFKGKILTTSAFASQLLSFR